MRRAKHAVIASRPPPQSLEKWLEEIAAAYIDGRDVIPFGPVVGANIREADIFHTAPSVCLKFRGIKVSNTALEKATNAALANYVVNQEREPDVFAKSHLAFAFCYLAAHLGVDLVDEEVVATAMDFVEEHEARLARMIRRGAKR